jgi:hypothetical protein
VTRPKSLSLALRPPPLENPLQREQNRAAITRRQAAPVGQKEVKLVVVVEEEDSTIDMLKKDVGKKY